MITDDFPNKKIKKGFGKIMGAIFREAASTAGAESGRPVPSRPDPEIASGATTVPSPVYAPDGTAVSSPVRPVRPSRVTRVAVTRKPGSDNDLTPEQKAQLQRDNLAAKRPWQNPLTVFSSEDVRVPTNPKSYPTVYGRGSESEGLLDQDHVDSEIGLPEDHGDFDGSPLVEPTSKKDALFFRIGAEQAALERTSQFDPIIRRELRYRYHDSDQILKEVRAKLARILRQAERYNGSTGSTVRPSWRASSTTATEDGDLFRSFSSLFRQAMSRSPEATREAVPVSEPSHEFVIPPEMESHFEGMEGMKAPLHQQWRTAAATRRNRTQTAPIVEKKTAQQLLRDGNIPEEATVLPIGEESSVVTAQHPDEETTVEQESHKPFPQFDPKNGYVKNPKAKKAALRRLLAIFPRNADGTTHPDSDEHWNYNIPLNMRVFSDELRYPEPHEGDNGLPVMFPRTGDRAQDTYRYISTRLAHDKVIARSGKDAVLRQIAADQAFAQRQAIDNGKDDPFDDSWMRTPSYLEYIESKDGSEAADSLYGEMTSQEKAAYRQLFRTRASKRAGTTSPSIEEYMRGRGKR